MNDEILIRAAQAGDQEAWHQLYARYQPRLHGLFRYWGSEAVEDLCQDTWERLARSLSSYQCSGVFWTWLTVVARRILWRKLQPERHVQIVYDVPSIAEDDVEQTAIGRVFALQLITRLPDTRDRQVLQLRVWHDLTFAEIGAQLGIEKVAARAYYERALFDLRAILQGIAPPEKHIHHAPSLSPAQQTECIRRYTSGEISVKALAELYGVSPITMNSYVRNTKTITCARCGAEAVRPGRANSRTCGPCLTALIAASERWCAEGSHAVPTSVQPTRGACAVCQKIVYQRLKAAGYYARTL